MHRVDMMDMRKGNFKTGLRDNLIAQFKQVQNMISIEQLKLLHVSHSKKQKQTKKGLHLF